MMQGNETKERHISPCPKCGYKIDAHTAVNATEKSGRAIPKEGDFSICFNCASVLRFDSNKNFIVATSDDVEKELDPDQIIILLKAVYLIKQNLGLT